MQDAERLPAVGPCVSLAWVVLVQDLATKATEAVGLIAGLFCESILGKGDPKPWSSH